MVSKQKLSLLYNEHCVHMLFEVVIISEEHLLLCTFMFCLTCFSFFLPASPQECWSDNLHPVSISHVTSDDG